VQWASEEAVSCAELRRRLNLRRPTDRPTDRPTGRPTDLPAGRSAVGVPARPQRAACRLPFVLWRRRNTYSVNIMSGDTKAPTLMSADDKAAGAPTVPKAGPALPALCSRRAKTCGV
jgi:hypothetical protein